MKRELLGCRGGIRGVRFSGRGDEGGGLVGGEEWSGGDLGCAISIQTWILNL